MRIRRRINAAFIATSRVGSKATMTSSVESHSITPRRSLHCAPAQIRCRRSCTWVKIGCKLWGLVGQFWVQINITLGTLNNDPEVTICDLNLPGLPETFYIESILQCPQQTDTPPKSQSERFACFSIKSVPILRAGQRCKLLHRRLGV